MIHQPGSSLLLMKLLEFVVCRVTEMTNPTGCDVIEGFRPQETEVKNRREILTSQFGHISFVRFLTVICIFKILNHRCWSDGGKIPVLF